MNYKMIAMDMDGTLLNSEKEVSENTKEILRRVSDMGVKLVVCTGRIFASAWIYADIIGTKAPIIASNGAYIREKDRDEVIYKKTLTKEEIIQVVRIVKEYGFYPHLFTSDTIYSEKLVFSSRAYDKWNEGLPEERKVKIRITEDLESAVEHEGDKILKVVVLTEMGEIEKLGELRREIERSLDVEVMSSMANNIEVMSKGISKGNAVKILAEYYGIEPGEIICVGDNENDLSMIRFAGMGIAMENATEELKAAADYITDTNDNDGVAKAIEKFILNREVKL
jgi:Cof subfamily protein (haloacid dehalogenase superfamily)